MKTAKILSVIAALGVLSASGFATTVGYVTKSVAPGAQSVIGSVFTTPADSATVGTSSGTVTGTASGSISDSAASFTSALAGGAIPYYVRITGGAAEGRIYKITSVTTSTTLAVSSAPGAPNVSADLPTPGSSDTYEIVGGATLSSFFSDVNVFGNTAFASADQIYIVNAGSFTGFYYNTTNSRWQNRFNVGGDQGFQVIEPWGAIFYVRSASASGSAVLISSGTVLGSDAQIQIPGSGQALLPLVFPVDITLDGTGIASLTSWTAGTAFASSDQLYINNTGAFTGYYYHSTNNRWQNRFNVGGDQGFQLINAGTPVFIVKSGSTASESVTISSPVAP